MKVHVHVRPQGLRVSAALRDCGEYLPLRKLANELDWIVMATGLPTVASFVASVVCWRMEVADRTSSALTELGTWEECRYP